MPFLRLQVLEERIVLDGAIGNDLAHAADSPTAPTPADTHPNLLVVAHDVSGADALVTAAREGIVTLTYDANNENLASLSAKIGQVLGDLKAESIAFATQGKDANFNLVKESAVNADTLQTSSMHQFWKDISSYLTPDGKVNILASNVAHNQDGVDLLNALGNVLNESGNTITVNASTDMTGSSQLGGNWNLEFSTTHDHDIVDAGALYFNTVALQSWSHVLMPGVTITAPPELMTSESGITDSLSLVLDSQPMSDVTIHFSVNNPNEVGLSTDSITFTPDNWNAPQLITLQGIADFSADGDKALTLITSNTVSSDPTYNNIALPDFNLINKDTTAISGSTQFSMITHGDITSIGSSIFADPSIANGGSDTPHFLDTDTFALTFNSSSSTLELPSGSQVLFAGLYWGGTLEGNSANNGLIGSVLLAGPGTSAYQTIHASSIGGDGISYLAFADITSLAQQFGNGDYTVANVVSSATVGSNGGWTLLVAYANSNEPLRMLKALESFHYVGAGPPDATVIQVPFNSGSDATLSTMAVGSPDATLLINGAAVVSPDLNTPFTHQANLSGTLSLAFTADAAAVHAFSVSVPEVLIYRDDALITSEAGTSVTFSVVLAQRPTAPVTIPLSSSNTAEGTLSASQLTFDASNWDQPQTVTLTGVDDNINDGNTGYTVNVGDTALQALNQDYVDPALLNVDHPNLLLVSNEVKGYESLVRSTREDTIVLVYQHNASDYSQISQLINDALNGRTAASIGFADDGTNGLFKLLSTQFVWSQTYASKPMFIDFWKSLSNDIMDGGAVNLLACSVGQNEVGLNFLDQLALLLNSNGSNITLNASTDDTGTATRGGNWILEYSSDDSQQVDAGALYFNQEAISEWNRLLVTGTISINTNTSANELNSGSSNFFATITLSVGPSGSVSMTVMSDDNQGSSDTANSGEDYAFLNTNVTFTAGQTTKLVSTAVFGDTKYEHDETFYINITGFADGADTYTLIQNNCLVTIFNDDALPTVAINNASATEGGTITFTITVTGTFQPDISLNYATAAISATANVDYTAVSGGPLIISSGTTSVTRTVTTLQDTIYETNETFQLTISSNNSDAQITDALGLGTINDNDTAPTLAINNVGINEGNSGTTTFTFTVTATGSFQPTISFNFATSNGTATTADSDYVSASGSRTITQGNTTATIAVTVNGDTKFEVNETFNVTISSPSNATISDGTGVGTITNDDASPTISINDVTAAEGNSGTQVYTFTVTRGGNSSFQPSINVNFATANNTATAGSDYTTTSGSLTFASGGATTQTISVTVSGDTMFEADESFFVDLSGVTNATVSDSQGLGTITNDDASPTISINDVTATEGNSGTQTYTFTVTRGGNSSFQSSINVNFATADSTATAGSDYTATSSFLTFISGGAATQSINVTVSGDVVYEVNEVFFVNLSGVTNATVSDSQGQGTITNNDTAPTLAINDVTASEGNSGPQTYTFTVTVTGQFQPTISVNYATADNTATTADSDYVAKSGVLNITSGQTTGTITVTVNGDTKFELNDSFFVNLTSPVNATITDTQGIGTLTNDDSQPTISINDPTVAEGNSGTSSLTFTVTLSNASYQSITVNYSTASGTATIADGDYAANVSGPLTFAVNSTSQQFSITVNGDTKFELNETVTATLSTPTNATISDSSGTGTISNDDAVPTVSIVSNVSAAEGNSGTSLFTFTISLSNPTYLTASVNFATSDNSATVADGDYVANSGSFSWSPGTATSQTVNVTVNGDVYYELNDIFNLALSNVANAVIGTGTAAGTITNDDASPTVTIDDVTHTEGNSGTVSYVFTISLTSLSKVTTVDYSTVDNTAKSSDSDFTAISGTALLNQGLTYTLTVNANGDTKYELDEVFLLSLTNIQNGTLGDGVAVGTIFNDDTSPTASINNVSITEGNSGAQNMIFTITLSNATYQTVSVDYITADNTATAGDSDFVAKSSTLTIAPNSISGAFNIVINADTKFEPTETFFVNLSNAINVALTNTQGIGTITNDDSQPTISINDLTINEGGAGTTTFTFTIALSNSSYQNISVNFATADGTATVADGDYTAASGIATINSGGLTASVVVNVAGDPKYEPTETFNVNLSAPTNATIADAQGVGTISNDDSVPTITINNVTLEEGNSGTTAFTFTVSLSNPSYQTITVNAATANGTATTANSDYAANSGLLTFASGVTTQQFTVLVNGDLAKEADESFFVNLTAPTNASIFNSTGAGLIINDENNPLVSINSGFSVTEPDSPNTTTITFTISLSTASTEKVIVTAATVNGTATSADFDFVAQTSQITFDPGQTSKTFVVTVNGDNKVETDESFTVAISNVIGGRLGTSTGTATILNNDSAKVSIVNGEEYEGDTGDTRQLSFTVFIDVPTAIPITVNYATSNGTAIAGSDYTAVSGTLTFTAGGAQQQTVLVTLTGDTKVESDETLIVTLSSPTNATLDRAQATGTIFDDDQVQFTVNDVTVTEGNSGTSIMTFTVSSTSTSDSVLSVNYATSNGIATAGSDYVATSGILTFNPGDGLTKTISVTINGDTTPENNETLILTLSNPVNGTISDGTGVGTINNDDAGIVTSIWQDLNGNGIRDAGEPGIAGLTVNLVDTGGGANNGATTTTNSEGYAVFTGIVTEQFRFDWQIPTGYSRTTAQVLGGATSSYDSDATSGTTTGSSPNFSYTAGTSQVNFSMGVTYGTSGSAGQIGDLLFEDRNGNGLQDSGDNGIGGQTISLYGVNYSGIATLLRTTVTTPTGAYSFTGLPDTGTILQSGALDIVIAIDNSDSSLTAIGGTAIGDVNGDGSSNTYLDAQVHALLNFIQDLVNAEFTSARIGIIRMDGSPALLDMNPVTAGTQIFTNPLTDADNNGQADITTVLLAIRRSVGAGSDWQGALTQANSYFNTLGTATGDGTFVMMTDGSNSGGNMNTILSTLSGAGRVIRAVGIGGSVDYSGSDSLNNVDTTGVAYNALTTNNVDSWAIGGQEGKTYNYYYITATAPSYGTFSPRDVGSNNSIDSDLDTTTGVSHNIEVRSDTTSNVDVGFSFPRLTINSVTQAEGNSGNTAFIFTVTLSSDPVANVTVHYATSDDSAIAGSDYTATSGTLTFTPGGSLTQQITVNVTGDTAYELNETFNLLLDTPTNASLASFKGVGTIVNDETTPSNAIITTIWRDLNGNGIQDVGDPGLSGLEVNLYLTSNPSTPFTSAITDSNGSVTFIVNPGTYFLEWEIQSGHIPTKTAVNGGSTAADDSDAVAISDQYAQSGSFTLASGQAILNYSAGLYYYSQTQTGKIGDFVFNDSNFNGVQNVGETGIANVTVGLYANIDTGSGPVSTLVRSTVTDNSGFYYFDGLVQSSVINNGATPNVVFVIDATSSSLNPFVGTAVGDQNGDGYSNTILDSEIALAKVMLQEIINSGYGSTARVAVVPFGRTADRQDMDSVAAGLQTYTSPLADTNSNSLRDAEEVLNAIRADGFDNFQAALGEAVFVLNKMKPHSEEGIIVYMSDGNHRGGSFQDEVQILTKRKGFTVNAFAMGANASLTPMQELDPNAQIVTDVSGYSHFFRDSSNAYSNDYVVGFTQPANSVYSPQDAGGNDALDSDVNAATGKTAAITLGLNEVNLSIDAGYSFLELTIDDVSTAEGNSGSHTMTFTVTLNRTSASTITVEYQTVDGTATTTPGNDYVAASGILTFNPGVLTQTIVVTVNGDTVVEGDETFAVNLFSVVNAQISDPVGIGTIIDDETAPTITISDSSITEGDAGTKILGFTVTLSGQVQSSVTVNYTTNNGTALTSDNDYVATSGTLTFYALQTSIPIAVVINGDTKFEPNETFTVDLSGATNAVISDSQGVGTILNDDGQPTVAINDVTANETNSGTTAFTFTVTLSNSSYQTITLNYTTTNGTATTADGDYAANSGALTFNPGETTKTITVLVNGDTKYENNETFTVDLSGLTNATFSDSQGLGTIVNDDAVPFISINNVTQVEGNSGTSSFVFTVTLSNSSFQTVTVNYATSDLLASVGDLDYTAASGTLTFNSGETSKTITVLVTGDTKPETDETFTVVLSNPSNASLVNDIGIGTIVNDDALPSITISDVTLSEGNSGTTNFNFNVTLSAATSNAVTVIYSTSSGTAVVGTDYAQILPTALVFLPGETTKQITVAVVGDTRYEANDTFFVDLTNPSFATIADNQGAGTINNDDSLPTISVNDVLTTEGNGTSHTVTFTVSLSNLSDFTTLVDVLTSDGTATTADSDYVAIALTTLTFLPGIATQTVTVTILEDTKFEQNETFNLNLSNPSNATISDNLGVGTINNDDSQPTISINSQTVTEGNSGTTPLTFTITLSNASYQTITVNYATSNGTATTADSDYTADSGTLTFTAGQTSQQVTVNANGDLFYENNETFTVTLSSPSNATIATGTGTGTINNDDAAPTLSVNDVTVTEGNSGTTNATFTVTRTGFSHLGITFNIATSDGTALAGSDYVTLSSSGSIAGDSSSSATTTFTVLVNGDLFYENNETFNVALSSATNINGSGNDLAGIGTINNDDSIPTLSISNISITEGNSGTTNATFTVTRTGFTNLGVTFNYATSDGTATAGVDYVAASSSGSIAANGNSTNTTTFTVQVNGDLFYENNETFTATLSSPTNATLSTAAATATIVNDDAAPTLTINDVTVTEGNNPGTVNAVFTVTRTGLTALNVTYNFATSDGTATAGSDYVANSATGRTIAADSNATATDTITVVVNGDDFYENNETFNVTLSGATNINASGNDLVGVGTILNDDAAPTLTINDVSVTEGNTPGTVNATFTVTRTGLTNLGVSFNYATSNGGGPNSSATAGADYTAASGSQTIAANGSLTATQQITIVVLSDNINENSENFTVTLSGATNINASGNDLTGLGTILDDDTVNITINDVTLTEGNSGTKNFTFTVTLSGTSEQTISIDYATADGTADSIDYTAVSGTLTFNPLQTSKTITVTVSGDLTHEADETFFVDLSNLVATDTANLAVTDSQGLGTITNDDSTALSINDVSINEGNSGTTTFTFTVTLSNASEQTITVDYATSDDSATTADNDYVAASGTLTFNPGETSKTFTVDVNGDVVDEPDEAFNVTLSDPTPSDPNVTIADPTGVGTIINDDSQRLFVDDIVTTEGNGTSHTIFFTVSLTIPSVSVVTVDVQTVNGTATAGSDYVAVPLTTLTFNPGDPLTQTVVVTILEDTVYEANETFFLNLSNPTNATIGDSQGVALINNDDAAPTLSIGDVTITEGDSGTVNAVFTVTRTGASDLGINFSYTTSDGTAIAGSDYAALSGNGTIIGDGQTSATTQITVVINGDLFYENDETFNVTLSGATNINGSGNDLIALGTIANDDAAPVLTIDDVSVVEGNAPGTTNVIFTVTRTGYTDLDVNFDFATSDLTALAGSDYTAASGNLTIAADGQLTATTTITVVITGDDFYENDETYNVTLSNATNIDGGGSDLAAEGTIVNNDAAPTLSINDVTVTEGNSPNTVNMTFTVTRTGLTHLDVNFDYDTADLSALAGSDYTAASGNTTIGADDQATATTTITIVVNGDDFYENDETLNLNLSNATNVNGSGNDLEGLGTILNDDSAPTLSIGNVSINEGNSPGTVNMTFTVTRTGLTDLDVNFDYATSDLSALDGSDYTAASGNLTIAADGQPTATTTFTVTIIGDNFYENDETFNVALSNATNIGSGGNTLDAIGTILNDDAAPTISIGDVTISEGDSPGTVNMTFTVTRTGTTSFDVNFNYATSNITALSGSDYTATSGNLTIAADGQPTATTTFTVTIIGDDYYENNETFNVTLTSPTNVNGSGNDLVAIGTIANDDAAPTLSISDVTVTEGNSPNTVNMTFTVTRTGLTNLDVNFDYATSDLTALDSSDYNAASGNLTIAADTQNSATTTFTVTVIGDDFYENDETFAVALSNATNINIAGNQLDATGTILNDDAAPTLSIGDVTVTEGNSPGTVNMTFTVTRTGLTNLDVNFDYATSDVTATDGSDYLAASGNTTIAADGQLIATTTITVVVLGDDSYENNETLDMTLSNATNIDSGDLAAVGTISDDDAAPTLSIGDVSVTEGDSPNTVNLVFTVTRTGYTALDVSFNYATADLTALDGSDYTAVSGSLLIAADNQPFATTTITIVVNGDDFYENDEAFNILLSDATAINGSGNDLIAQGTILNDEAAPTLSIGDVSVTEGNSPNTVNMTFTVTRTGLTNLDVDFNYSTSDLTATAGSDYVAASGSLTIAADGQPTAATTITIVVIGDDYFENNETLNISLSGASNINASGNDLVAAGTITDDDTAPTLSIGDVTVTEGNSPNTVNMTFTITRTGYTSFDVAFDYAASDITAAAGSDYSAASGSLTIAADAQLTATTTVTITIIGDDYYENDETLALTLTGTNNINSTGNDLAAVGTILNDDAAPTLSISDAAISEGNSPGTVNITFTVTRTGLTNLDVNFNYATSDITALAGSDYVADNGGLTIAADGQPTATTTLTIVIIGDNFYENNETFNVTLSGATNINSSGNDLAAVGTISNDDAAPTLTIDDVTVSEGNSPGTVNMTFTVTRTGLTDLDVNFNYITSDITTTAGSDYTGVSGSLTIAADSQSATSTTITVVVLGDNFYEIDETFSLTLSGATNIALAGNTLIGTGTILDDDAVVISISDVTQTEGNSGDSAFVFTVTLNNTSSQAISVDFTTANGTAGSSDYAAISGTLTFAPGETTKQITVLVHGDLTEESDEAFTVTLSNLSPNGDPAISFNNTEATGTIVNDDVVTITATGASQNEGNAGNGTFTFIVILSNPSDQTITMAYHTSNSTADSSDYLSTSGLLVFAPGETFKVVTVLVIGDAVIEGDEQFNLQLDSLLPLSSAITFGNDSAIGTIVNDDNNDLPPFVIPPEEEPPKPPPSEEPEPPEIAPPTLDNFGGTPMTATYERLYDALSLYKRDNDANARRLPDIQVSQLMYYYDEHQQLKGVFTIYLTVKPEAPVSIKLSGQSLPDKNIAPTTLTFTPQNWEVPQMVTISGVSEIKESDGSPVKIVTEPAISADPNYNNIDPQDVNFFAPGDDDGNLPPQLNSQE